MRETFIVSLFFWATLDLEHLISVVFQNCGLYLSFKREPLKLNLGYSGQQGVNILVWGSQGLYMHYVL